MCISQRNDFLNRRDMIGDPGFHRGRDAQGLMDTSEVVVHVEQRHGMAMILNLLAERILSAA
jgi:hypothetical protein